ncbi:MAG: SsrA-binding protein SmpB [Acidimicrobiales bacterium]|nr:SsrA-binding protein SmpB [Acidimicrobiales bacterium]
MPAPEQSTRDKSSGKKVVATNRRARHEYDVLDTIEAGLVLRGSEVKSLRDAKVQLADGFARVAKGEAWLHQVHISPWLSAGLYGRPDPDRVRKLLLHKSEIERLGSRLDQEPSLTLVPLSIYFSDGNAKVELGIARGRKQYDKRQVLAKRDADLEAKRAMRAGRARRS